MIRANRPLISDPIRCEFEQIFLGADADFADDEGGYLVPDHAELRDGAEVIDGEEDAEEAEGAWVARHQRLGRGDECRDDILWEISERFDSTCHAARMRSIVRIHRRALDRVFF